MISRARAEAVSKQLHDILMWFGGLGIVAIGLADLIILSSSIQNWIRVIYICGLVTATLLYGVADVCLGLLIKRAQPTLRVIHRSED